MSVRARDLLVVALATLSVCCGWGFLVRGRGSNGQWSGVDDAVIGRFVEESGHHSPPLLDWIRGDALLFAFLVAGLLAGFVLGFCVRAAFGREERV